MDAAENNRLAELLIELAQGNTQALTELDKIMQRILFSIGKTYYKDNEEIKDSIEDLYVVLGEKAKSFNYNKSAYTWIIKVYKNFVISKLRKKKLEKDYIETEKQYLKTKSFKSIEKEIEYRLWYDEILSKLNPKEKDLLRFSTRGFTVREIAEILHKPKSTVENRLKKLKEKVNKM